jgi:RHS repeat-associated protein
VISYTYDEQDQLTSETDSISGNTIHYTYDALGNRETKIVKDAAGKVLSTTNYTYNAMNQLTAVNDEPLTYNENGQLTDSGEIHYDWDADGHLIQASRKVDGSSIASYDYDEQGRRIRSVVGDITANYVYDGISNRVLYETNASNQMTCYYTYTAGGHLLSMTRVGGDTYFYHYNAHGDVIAVTDAQQNTVATYTYDAWGNILSQSGSFAEENPYRYAGYRYDKETGLYYLMARYYNPQHGNFLSLDPDPGDEDDPQTQNGYNYANNNPVIGTDPDGHFVWFAVGLAFAAYDIYQAYKSGASWKRIALAGAFGLIGGGRFKLAAKVVKRVSGGLKTGRKISDKQAINRLKKGKDVFSTSKKKAKKLMKKASYGNKKVIHDTPHDTGYRSHYHHKERKKGYGHSFY